MQQQKQRKKISSIRAFPYLFSKSIIRTNKGRQIDFGARQTYFRLASHAACLSIKDFWKANIPINPANPATPPAANPKPVAIDSPANIKTSPPSASHCEAAPSTNETSSDIKSRISSISNVCDTDPLRHGAGIHRQSITCEEDQPLPTFPFSEYNGSKIHSISRRRSPITSASSSMPGLSGSGLP